MTSNGTTATVETITAEVRTLMVGSRQVTGSVYNQLDEVAPGVITPFGRVTPKDAWAGYVYIVGKDIETGELVRASTPTTMPLIRRTVAANSKADSLFTVAEAARAAADKAEKKAAERDREAAELLDGPRWDSATSYDENAAAAAGKAESADTTLDQLKALAEAADKRYRAERSREGARKKQAEAAELRAQAERERARADRAEAEAQQWNVQDAKHVDRLSALADEWVGMPLIVLAGLR